MAPVHRLPATVRRCKFALTTALHYLTGSTDIVLLQSKEVGWFAPLTLLCTWTFREKGDIFLQHKIPLTDSIRKKSELKAITQRPFRQLRGSKPTKDETQKPKERQIKEKTQAQVEIRESCARQED